MLATYEYVLLDSPLFPVSCDIKGVSGEGFTDHKQFDVIIGPIYGQLSLINVTAQCFHGPA